MYSAVQMFDDPATTRQALSSVEPVAEFPAGTSVTVTHYEETKGIGPALEFRRLIRVSGKTYAVLSKDLFAALGDPEISN